MCLVIVGQGPFGEKVLGALIERGEDVIGVFSPPDRRGEPMKQLTEKAGISFFCPSQMKNPEVYETYVNLKPDLVILAFVTDIIPPRLLDVPSIGTICYHPSLLPKHRGASAINWAIIMGDTHTGLTIFWVDKGIDTGPILLQKKVEIGPNETTGSLYFNTLFPMGVDAMVQAVELIKKGKAPRIPQDDSKATYEPPCDDRVAALDFERSIKDVYDFIRGCDPQPGAYTTLRGKKVRLYDAKMESSPIEKKAGEVISFNKETVQIAVKGGIVKIAKLRVDKDKIGPMEFGKLVDLKKGDRFGE
jgi:methionyl-tRNA formyltransferase